MTWGIIVTAIAATVEAKQTEDEDKLDEAAAALGGLFVSIGIGQFDKILDLLKILKAGLIKASIGSGLAGILHLIDAIQLPKLMQLLSELGDEALDVLLEFGKQLERYPLVAEALGKYPKAIEGLLEFGPESVEFLGTRSNLDDLRWVENLTKVSSTIKKYWKIWNVEDLKLYLGAQERIANGSTLVRRMSNDEYNAIFTSGRGGVDDVYQGRRDPNVAWSIERKYAFKDSDRNIGSGYERIVSIPITEELRSFLSANFVPDNIAGGLPSELKPNPRYKLEQQDFNVLIPQQSWNRFRELIQNHTVE